jgi:hypothetical protein
MTVDRSPAQKRVLDDLLQEKTLWDVYKQSRRIPFSRKTNVVATIVAGLLVYMASAFLGDSKPGSLVDATNSLAETGLSASIGLLGFLLAGFAFFATVSDKSMFFRMAEATHSKSGLSFLKYNFYGFMRVFCEYLLFALSCLLITQVTEPGSAVREFLSSMLDKSVEQRRQCAAVALGGLFGAFVYILMQLKSFIFNVYHVVMTSIRWSLEEEYDREVGSQDNKPPTSQHTSEK